MSQIYEKISKPQWIQGVFHKTATSCLIPDIKIGTLAAEAK